MWDIMMSYLNIKNVKPEYITLIETSDASLIHYRHPNFTTIGLTVHLPEAQISDEGYNYALRICKTQDVVRVKNIEEYLKTISDHTLGTRIQSGIIPFKKNKHTSSAFLKHPTKLSVTYYLLKWVNQCPYSILHMHV